MAGYYDETTGDWIDTGNDPGVTQNPLDNTSGTGTMAGWDYSNGVWKDPSGKTYDMSYITSNDQLNVMGIASKIGQTAFNKLASAFVNPNGTTDWKSVLGAAGGLYGAYQSQQAQPKTGYQGSIPKYEAVREKVANTYDPNRRPGSGNQQYFTDTKYVAPADADAAHTAAKEEAAGLEALNKANPAREAKAVLQAGSEKAEAAKQESRPASDVIKDLPIPKQNMAAGGLAGLAQGRYLGGTTDGMADKIPASIGGKQEARLSHGEFVIPADVVGHLGNGNSDAGAKRLYEMMDRIRQARTGTTKQGKQINPDKFLA